MGRKKIKNDIDPQELHVHRWKTELNENNKTIRKCCICHKEKQISYSLYAHLDVIHDNLLTYFKGTRFKFDPDVSGGLKVLFETPENKTKVKKTRDIKESIYKTTPHFFSMFANQRLKPEKQPEKQKHIYKYSSTRKVKTPKLKYRPSWLIKPPDTIMDNYIQILPTNDNRVVELMKDEVN